MKSAKNAIVGPVEIKCPRCGTLTSLRPLEPVPERPDQNGQSQPSNIIQGSRAHGAQ
ncbi:MAG: Com family DNA-binding transcriptional regulator [Labrenzia sp.]